MKEIIISRPKGWSIKQKVLYSTLWVLIVVMVVVNFEMGVF